MAVSAQELNDKMRMARMKPVLRDAQWPHRENDASRICSLRTRVNKDCEVRVGCPPKPFLDVGVALFTVDDDDDDEFP